MYNIEMLTAEHLPMLHELMWQLVQERKYLGMSEVEAVEQFTENFKAEIDQKSPLFVAVYQEKVVGWCFIYRNRNPIFQHVGQLFTGVTSELRGMGVGTALLQHTLEAAEHIPMLRRIVLEVCAPNTHAICLYQNAGFVLEGVKRAEYFVDGKYCDVLIMGLMDQQLCQEHAGSQEELTSYSDSLGVQEELATDHMEAADMRVSSVA